MKQFFEVGTKEQLISNFNNVVSDTEALLKATSNHGGDAIDEIRKNIGNSIKAVKADINYAETLVVEKTKVAAKATDVYVHQNPWEAVGVAATIGLIIGWLMGRK